MKNGFLKVALSKIPIIIADPITNVKTIIEKIKYLNNKNVKIFLTPELSLVSNSCNDLLFNQNLISNIYFSIELLIEETKNIDMLITIGTPIIVQNAILNVSIILHKGKILGIIPKCILTQKETRYFENNFNNIKKVIFLGNEYDLTSCLIINDIKFLGLSISIILGDLFEQYQKVKLLKDNGVNIILNPCCYNINSYISSEYISNKLSIISRETNTIIITSSSGYGESNSNDIFLGYQSIFECGENLYQSDIFTSSNKDIITEVDFHKTKFLNYKKDILSNLNNIELKNINIDFISNKTILTRKFSDNPFLNSINNDHTFNKIFNMQVFALKSKLTFSKSNGIIIALSGGLDSTLALIIAHKCCIDLNLKLLVLIMPGFGTSERSYNNSNNILKKLNIDSKCIPIINSVKQHFKDINHSINNKNNVYENAQSRERTQIALDLSNKFNYLFVGTSNLSELALGWTTFAGDHISHYSINSGIPKTVIKKLLEYICENINIYKEIKNIVNDILNSPISPELIKNQNTEDIIGPYELHDFFLYHFIKNNFSIKKIYLLSCYVFEKKYTHNKIKKSLNLFVERFFSQQFKRNCCVEGPKIFDMSLSPYNDFILSSDLQFENLTKSFLI